MPDQQALCITHCDDLAISLDYGRDASRSAEQTPAEHAAITGAILGVLFSLLAIGLVAPSVADE